MLRDARSVLITGAAGFIGSHVACELAQAYPSTRFVGFDILQPCASIANLADLNKAPNFTFVRGDIVDVDSLASVFAKYDIDLVMHFAAETSVDKSFVCPDAFARANVLGTVAVLECCRRFRGRIRLLLHVSTDEVYGETPSSIEQFDEDAPLCPRNPYAMTKAVAEIVLRHFCRKHRLPFIITRSNNVYGPRQYPEKIVPKFICRLLRGQTCPVHGSGDNQRTYLYVSDAVAAFRRITERGELEASYNIGGGDEISNVDVARRLAHIWEKPDHQIIEYAEDRLSNDCRYRINASKLAALGWVPTVAFDDGLRQTIDWYRQHHDTYWGDIEPALEAHYER
ncbi:NAD(P)-binding domain-containing protein [Plasmodiophora brassicae]